MQDDKSKICRHVGYFEILERKNQSKIQENTDFRENFLYSRENNVILNQNL